MYVPQVAVSVFVIEHAKNLDTLDAYIHEYGRLVPYLAPGVTDKPPSDTAPIDLTTQVISLQASTAITSGDAVSDTHRLTDCIRQLPVIQDTAPLGKNFGDVLVDVAVESPYRAGDTVVAQFVGCVRMRSAFMTDNRSDPVTIG